MIGWAIFGAMKKLLKCLKLVKNAKSLSDLDKAAEMMADAIVALGVETLIGLLTRGAGRMKAKSSGGSGGGAAGGGKPRTQKEIEADNKAKADAAKKKEEAPAKRKTISGKKFEGTGYRYSDPEYKNTSFETGPWNANANHRYSGVGDEAVYAGTKAKTAHAEISAYGPTTGKVLVKENLKLEKALDLTDAKVRDALGVDLDQITKTIGKDKYKITQNLAQWARKNGFDGIIAPSARLDGGANIVILKS